MEDKWKGVINGCEITEDDFKDLTPEQLKAFIKELITFITKLQREEEELLAHVMDINSNLRIAQ